MAISGNANSRISRSSDTSADAPRLETYPDGAAGDLVGGSVLN